MEDFDYVIIGSGILALSTAFRLRQAFPEASIAVVGPEIDNHGATKCAGAMINVYAEIPNNGFAFETTSEKLRLLIEAEKVWDAFCDEVAEYAGHDIARPSGETHVILNSRSTDIEVRTFEYIREWLLKNHAVKDISPNVIPGLNPTDRGTTIRAMTIPDRHVNPHKVLDGLRNALHAMNITLVDDRVSSISTRRKQVEFIRDSQGRIYKAKDYVFANGFNPESHEIYDALGVMPVFANGGCALKLSMPDWVAEKGGLGNSLNEMNDVIRMVDRGGACGIHLVPTSKGEFYLGASSAVWTSPEFKPKMAAVQVLLNSALNEINAEFWHYDLEIIGNGFRPATVDAMPLIGLSKCSNAFILNGFKRDGFTASPYVSKLIVEAIESRQNPVPIFSPTRKLLSYKTKDAAIEDSLNISAASMFQHYQNISPLKKEAYRKADELFVHNVYKRVRSDFGIHPEMLHLYADTEFFKTFKGYL